jgi:hypothetical protein
VQDGLLDEVLEVTYNVLLFFLDVDGVGVGKLSGSLRSRSVSSSGSRM